MSIDFDDWEDWANILGFAETMVEGEQQEKDSGEPLTFEEILDLDDEDDQDDGLEPEDYSYLDDVGPMNNEAR